MDFLRILQICWLSILTGCPGCLTCISHKSFVFHYRFLFCIIQYCRCHMLTMKNIDLMNKYYVFCPISPFKGVFLELAFSQQIWFYFLDHFFSFLSRAMKLDIIYWPIYTNSKLVTVPINDLGFYLWRILITLPLAIFAFLGVPHIQENIY